MSSGQHTQTAHAEGAQGVNRLGLVIFIMSEAVLFANLIAASPATRGRLHTSTSSSRRSTR